MKMHMAVIAMVLAMGLGAGWHPTSPAYVPLTPREQMIKSELTRLVRQENEAIIAHNAARLAEVFLPGTDASRAALDHARERQAFLDAWSKARGVEGLSVRISLRTPHIAFINPDRVVVFGVVSEAYHYHYRGEKTDFSFGLGTRHDYILQTHQGRWYIRLDHFTDPLDQNTRIPTAAKPAEGLTPIPPTLPTAPGPGAAKAVAYADTYCGAAPGCGNQGRYNTAYNNYNGEGGDCTNFISQALRAGGFRETPSWSYDRRLGEGNRGWSNARGLIDFLESSGRAALLARGRFDAVTRPRKDLPYGAIAGLRPGDLISYIENGRAVHTAIVVGYDPHGIPVVDSHTSDRFHVPWDLGWDKSTRYLLWKIRYPVPKTSSVAPKKPGRNRPGVPARLKARIGG